MTPALPETPSRFGPSVWLRWLGTTTFLAATVGFLVEGWTDAQPFLRELSWAAVTLGLTVLGILAVRRFRDPAGARVFLALAAATIPAHFAQVGAQIWGYFFEGTSSAWGVVFGGAVLLLLAPPLSLGVSALVRKRGALLTALLFALSCPLLIPSRNGDLASVLALTELLILGLFELRIFRSEAPLQTVEGALARALLLAPCGILLVRNGFYVTTHLWTATLIGAPSLVLLTLPHVSRIGGRIAQVMQSCAVAGLCLAACLAVSDWHLLALTLSAIGLVGSRATFGQPKTFAVVGSIAFVLSGIAAAIWPSTAYALMVVPIGTIHALSAFHRRSALLLVASVAATLVGLIGQLGRLVHWPGHDFWLLPATLGVTLLVVATLFERHRSGLERLWLRLSAHFGEVSR